MKNIVFLLALAFAVAVVPGCQTAPSERVVAVQTLRAIGSSGEAAVSLSAQLYRDGKITPAQSRAVIDFYDSRFQPAFRLAVTAAKSNLDSFASPDLVSLASQLTALVSQFYTPPPR